MATSVIAPPAPGLYQVEPKHEYPMLHQSIATHLLRSPLHGWHKAFCPDPEEYSDTLARGELSHKLLLGQGRNIVIVDAPDWRTKDAREQRIEAAKNGQLAVLKHKHAESEQLIEGVIADLDHRGIKIHGTGMWNEVTSVWQTPMGVWCSGRFDHFNESERIIIDFKFTADASKKKCEARFIEHGYDIQHAAYIQAAETIFPQLAGRFQMLFVFIEIEPPHATRLMPLAGSMRTSGQWRWGKACDIWRECLDIHGTQTPWPAYRDDGVAAECPAWAMAAHIAEEEEREGGTL